MFRTFTAMIFIAALATGCTKGSKKNDKTTADNANKGTAKSGPVVKRKKSGELCEGENCPGYIQ